jgi:hypothetical protein
MELLQGKFTTDSEISRDISKKMRDMPITFPRSSSRLQFGRYNYNYAIYARSTKNISGRG